MPAIYAHRAFGEDLKKRLPPERFAEVFAHPDCFALGLHGPDTLFYFHPLGKMRSTSAARNCISAPQGSSFLQRGTP